MDDPAVRIREVEVLGAGRHVLRSYKLDYRRRDGASGALRRETCKRGASATALLYSPRRGSVVLTRQFRLPVLLDGGSGGRLLEAPGGLLDGEAPADAIRREVEEETGFRVDEIHEVFSAYMSPALATERTHFFVADVDACERSSDGGGLWQESEDVEVVELPLSEATEMVARGEIVDAKTILLLQYAQLNALVSDPRVPTDRRFP
jgi:nudix-type nucleoside diphosphatase (YffH/AdpP family)